jgi:hypothetical protein
MTGKSVTDVCDLSFDIDDLFEACDAADMTEFEEDFIADLKDRYKKFGPITGLTERQHSVVMRIYEKYC